MESTQDKINNFYFLWFLSDLFKLTTSECLLSINMHSNVYPLIRKVGAALLVRCSNRKIVRFMRNAENVKCRNPIVNGPHLVTTDRPIIHFPNFPHIIDYGCSLRV